MSSEQEPQPTEEQQPKTENNSSVEEDIKENGTGDAAAANAASSPAPQQTESNENDAQKPKEMRAVVLMSFGGLKSVKIMKKDEPTAGEGEVLIRVKACGLNFQDLMVRQGAVDSPPKCPFILGFECAGEIEQIGEGVEGFSVGDKVVALPEYRAWAELVAVPAKYIYKLPEELGPLDAAAITMNYTVAYILLFELAGLSKGKRLLVHSVGGGVGQAIVQLAKTVPDVTVFGVCSKSKHEALKANNSPIDHLLERGSDYSSEIRKIQPDGVDIVLDCLCGDECNKGFSLLKPMGKYILYGSSNIVTGETKSFFSAARSWWQVDKVSPIKLFEENKTLSGFNLRRLMYQQDGSEFVRKAVENVFDLYKEGKIKPILDSTWALEDVAEAMQKMHDRKNIGKLILDPSMEPKPKPATPAKGKNKEDKKKQSSEEKKESDEKKEAEAKVEEKKEEKKEEIPVAATNGDSATTNGESDPKAKENSS